MQEHNSDEVSVNSEVEANFAELRRRGITAAVAASFGLRFETNLPFAFHEGIVIPVNHPDGSFAFNKYRRSYINNDIKQKYAYDKGSHTALFGADRINDAREVTITEGEMDAMVLWSKGIPAVTSTGGSQSFQEAWRGLFDGKRVYLCYDNDDAGAEGIVKTLEILPEAYVIFIPEVTGVKDISDFVSRGGDFHALMRTARQYRNLEDVEADKSDRASQWLPTRFHDAYIKRHKEVERRAENPVDYSGDDKVLRAKAVPCTQLIKFNRVGNAVCLWHSDRTPSLHYYPKKNNCYCHSCGKFADSIDIVMAQHSVGFKEAVKILNNDV